MLFGNVQFNLPSRFINEIDPKYIEEINKKTNIISKAINFTKENMFKEQSETYKVGEHIKHEKYGIGVITDVGNTILTIAFPHPYGIRKLMKNHKSITKIT